MDIIDGRDGNLNYLLFEVSEGPLLWFAIRLQTRNWLLECVTKDRSFLIVQKLLSRLIPISAPANHSYCTICEMGMNMFTTNLIALCPIQISVWRLFYLHILYPKGEQKDNVWLRMFQYLFVFFFLSIIFFFSVIIKTIRRIIVIKQFFFPFFYIFYFILWFSF